MGTRVNRSASGISGSENYNLLIPPGFWWDFCLPVPMLTLIFDLDNTIYPVSSIADELFPPLFHILEKPEYGMAPETLCEAKREIMRRPFQKVAEEFSFPQEMTLEALELLRSMTFEGPMKPFEDYLIVRTIPARRFLVTTGFYRLQMSKVEQLQIREDFEEIFIADPDRENITKKDIIKDIWKNYDLVPTQTIVIGDDPHSEIKAGNELGMKTFLVDMHNAFTNAASTCRATRLADLRPFLENQGLLKNSPSERS